MENIDDELDETGIVFVTTEDTALAKKHGIKNFPALAFFRNKDLLVYKGDIEDEDEVLAWITDEETLEIPGRIEEVNMRMLEKILHENEHVVVFFYKEGDKKSQKIIQELENIDDECEEKDIDFVKTSDEGVEKEYDLKSLPALAFYRNKFRQIYTGDLMDEDAILDWVLSLHTSTPDIIENVDRKTLQTLINDVEHLAVFFYNEACESCQDILEELETIDDDTDKHGIQFVKSTDSKLAAEIGIFSFPALVYYETGVPIMYDGNLKKEEEVLEWLVEQKRNDVDDSDSFIGHDKADSSECGDIKGVISGDGCFYMGLGGKNARVMSSFEPYRCCPTKLKMGSKSANVNKVSQDHREGGKSSSSNSGKNAKQDKSNKGKKGFFGSGKYTWWW
ncbi:hypothetical protein J437_LFUL015983 [Ladona fulva]|uniref:Thioredoxin domain-containing protein n=1 Tax=Ladona fulva TaxID=123851 RepID=A0A8K0P672_LADFU|nr:hypothetical protein J437_LFUL015983 [Ladona fulva]